MRLNIDAILWGCEMTKACKECGGTGIIKYYHDAGDHFSAGASPYSEWREKPCHICRCYDKKDKSLKNHKKNMNLYLAAPKMLEVLQWLDNEMDCRDDDFGGCLFTRGDFVMVREAIRLAVKGK